MAYKGAGTAIILTGIFLGGCEKKTETVPSVDPRAPVTQSAGPTPAPVMSYTPRSDAALSPVFRTADPDMKLTLPDGAVVLVDADKLDPQGRITVGFLCQLDPHAVRNEAALNGMNPYQQRLQRQKWDAYERLAASTDEALITQIKAHLLEAHRLNDAQIEDLRQRCLKIIGARPAVNTGPAPGPG